MLKKNFSQLSSSKRRFEPEDIFLEQRISEVHAIDGKDIAVCSVKRIDAQQDQYTGVLWAFSLDGTDSRQLTQGPGVDDSPRWSPDGRRIAFLGDRHGGSPQIYVIEVSGGEARQLTHFTCAAQLHAWRPDGKRLLALFETQVDPDRHAEGTLPPADLQRSPRDSNAPEVVWRLPFKADGQGYKLDRRVHLFLVDAENGSATQLTRGDFDVSNAVWSPDGRRIAYTCSRNQAEQEHCSDLWVLDVDDNGACGEPIRMSRDQPTASAPSWSPDGRWIAFTAATEAGDAQLSLWLCEPENRRVRQLGDQSIEVAPGDLLWQSDSQRLSFIRAHRGLQHMASITVPGGELHGIDSGPCHVMHLAASRRLVYTIESPDRALELYSANWDGSDERQLSHFNSWWTERELPQVSLRSFEVPDGDGGLESIDGWLMLPPQGKQQQPLPLLVEVHGGPASYAFVQFPKQAWRQMLCARGFAVLALNPVGSSSYGRRFAARLQARWGELDLPQQLAAVKQLQKEEVVDERVAITGSSYGGYLTAYAIGNTDMFRAAVVCAPVGNLETHYGTSDSGYYCRPVFDGGQASRQPRADAAAVADGAHREGPHAHIVPAGQGRRALPQVPVRRAVRQAASQRRARNGDGVVPGRQPSCVRPGQAIVPTRRATAPDRLGAALGGRATAAARVAFTTGTGSTGLRSA